jgi:pyruvate ferredoxin oxidoreductase delta subunit
MKQIGWKDIPIGGLITKAGSAHDYHTGDWRDSKPVVTEEKCTQCLLCWLYCPDSAVIVKDAQKTHIDYDHCKGCGICASVCPAGCIQMQEEHL